MGTGADTLYRYRLDSEAALYPDPASRFQPRETHGPSQVIDPGIFNWHDSCPGHAALVLRPNTRSC